MPFLTVQKPTPAVSTDPMVVDSNALGLADPEGLLRQEPLAAPPSVNVLGLHDPEGTLPAPQTPEEWQQAVKAHGVDLKTGGDFATRTALSFIKDPYQAHYLQRNYGAENVIRIGPAESDLAYRSGPDKPFIAVKPEGFTWASVGTLAGEAAPAVLGIVGGVYGGVPGAAAGGGAGELVNANVRSAMGFEGQSTGLELAKDVATTGLTQGAFEGVGKYLLAPAAHGITEEARGLWEEGKHLLPSQFQAAGSVGQKVLSFIEKTSDILPWKPAAKLRADQQTGMESWAKELSKYVDVGELGEVVADLASKQSGIGRNAIGKIFSKVDEVWYKGLTTDMAERGAGAVNVEALKHQAAEALLPSRVTGGSMSDAGRELYTRVAKLDDTASFREVHTMLDDLSALIRERGPGTAEAIRVREAARTAMETAGMALKGEEKNLYIRASNVYKAGDTFTLRALQGLSAKIEAHPEMVVPHLLESPSASVVDIMANIDGRAGRQLQEGTIAHIMNLSRDAAGNLDLATLKQSFEAIPKDTITAIFAGEESYLAPDGLKAFLKTAEIVGLQSNPVGSRAIELGSTGFRINTTVQNLGKLATFAGPLHLLTQGAHLAGGLATATFTLSGVAIAKLLMTEPGRMWLSTGLRIPLLGAQGTQWVARGLSIPTVRDVVKEQLQKMAAPTGKQTP